MTDAAPRGGTKLLRTEDYWAIWLGLLIIGLALAFFSAGSTLKPWAVAPGSWASLGELGDDFAAHWSGYLAVGVGFAAVFALSMRLMGRPVGVFLRGYGVLFLGSLAIFYLAGWEVMERWDLGAPLLALLVGLVIGNLRAMPDWIKAALRTEYYIKTGIVLLGATLPLTLIAQAGPIAFIQATIVSVTTWLTIYLAATRLFGLDPRFGAVLGTGGAVCGVSGSIAIGGAVRADKDHIAIGIAVVSVWAIVMILVLAIATKVMIPAPGNEPTAWWQVSPAEAGAWVGTSEYADAAGFAVVAEIAQQHGEAPIHAFTLMKVIGRDIWIGIWAFVLSIVSVVFWEKKRSGGTGPEGRVGLSVVWERFPKFVLGFFAASVLVSVISANPPADHVGVVGFAGTFKAKTGAQPYAADFAGYVVPAELAGRLQIDGERRELRFSGGMSKEELELLSSGADGDQQLAFKALRAKSDWNAAELGSKVIGPIKSLRSWAFVLCFLCIGLSTRFRELATFGLKPFWAFTVGVLVNVPLGYLLTTVVFSSYWRGLQ